MGTINNISYSANQINMLKINFLYGQIESLKKIIIIVVVKIKNNFMGRYLTAILTKHLDSKLPFISDTGVFSPESCVFSQMMNLGAFVSEYISHR